jgi:hypothetical protein
VANDVSLCFVGASRGNAFMNELLAAVAYEAEALGVRSEMRMDSPPPPSEEQVLVLVPHEYYATVPKRQHPTPAQRLRSVALCTEQPGTPWFEVGVDHAAGLGAAMDISRTGARELRRRGVAAEHFRLGYTRFWDTWDGDESRARPTDVLYLGGPTDRRLRALAGYGSTLWARRTRLLIPPELPKSADRADFLTGRSKWHCLRSAKTLLNVHRQESPYFEWMRALEAIANGCVVVTEHSVDYAPLVPGEHLAIGSVENLALLADALLRDEEQLRAMRQAAYGLVRDELPMRPATERLVAVAASLPRRRRRTGRDPGRLGRMRTGARELARRATYDPRIDRVLEHQHELGRRSRRSDAAIKRLVLGQMQLSRSLAAHEAALRGEDPAELRVLAATPAYEHARPRVSVLTPLYNYAREVRSALASVARSDAHDVEAVVLDDASTDGSAEAVLEVFAEHPYVPMILLQHRVNCGLGRTRNDLARAARGGYVFMLDADNEVFPTALSRLVEALDADPGASFAYSMLEVHVDGEPEELRSFHGWDRELLQYGNFVDAMALFRRQTLLDLGGYAEDLRLHGWEDYDLWCRYAEDGLRGVLVPEILARYRRSEHSMLASVTDLDRTEAESILRARYPRTMSGGESRIS